MVYLLVPYVYIISILPCSSERYECYVLKLPGHTTHLILVRESTMNPPFSPRPFNLNMEVISKHLEPFESASNRNICIHISRVNPNFVSSFHQNGIHIISGIFVHNVVLLDFVIAWIPSSHKTIPLHI